MMPVSVPRKPRTDDPDHRALELEVLTYLESQDFIVGTNAYHDAMPPPLVDCLKYKQNQTALVVRTSADKVAAHKNLDHTLLFEAKTKRNREYSDLVIEALPLAIHRAKARAAPGYRCLYVYRDVLRPNLSGCFWCTQNIPADLLRIPQRFGWMEPGLTAAYPGVRVKSGGVVGGSNDPFIRIPGDVLEAFLIRDWRAEISADLARVAQPVGVV